MNHPVIDAIMAPVSRLRAFLSDEAQMDNAMRRMSLRLVLSRLVDEMARRLEEVYPHLPDDAAAYAMYSDAEDMMGDEDYLDAVELIQELWNRYLP